MALPKMLVDFAWYADGVGKIAEVPKIKLPDLNKVMEEYSAGGMAGSVEIFMGMIETLTSTVTLASPDPEIMKLFGITNGDERQFTFRGAISGRDGTDSYVIRTLGQIKNWNPDEIERKKLSQVNVEITHTTLKIEHAGKVIVDIDVEGGTLIIDNVDLRSNINSALGI